MNMEIQGIWKIRHGQQVSSRCACILLTWVLNAGLAAFLKEAGAYVARQAKGVPHLHGWTGGARSRT